MGLQVRTSLKPPSSMVIMVTVITMIIAGAVAPVGVTTTTISPAALAMVVAAGMVSRMTI